MILSNQVQCLKCEDEIYSSNRHDYRSCSCGAISVDGGMSYLRRVGNKEDYKEMSIVVPDKTYTAMMKSIDWALKTGRNKLGILCAIARAHRDGKFGD